METEVTKEVKEVLLKLQTAISESMQAYEWLKELYEGICQEELAQMEEQPADNVINLLAYKRKKGYDA